MLRKFPTLIVPYKVGNFNKELTCLADNLAVQTTEFCLKTSGTPFALPLIIFL